MSITVLNYHDQALVDTINAQARARAEAAKAAEAQASSTSFSTVLNNASQSYATCPDELLPIFQEASATYGVSVDLLTSIAKAESGFNASAVSSAGAIGVMQLMPATAASLGVSNSYDARENIMGGAKLISQLLSRYNGDTSLALAAYNAGCGNVDKYGGIPPFEETQNYVSKVLSYLGNASSTAVQTISNTADTVASTVDAVSDNANSVSDNVAEEARQLIESYLNSNKISTETLELLQALLKIGS